MGSKIKMLRLSARIVDGKRGAMHSACVYIHPGRYAWELPFCFNGIISKSDDRALETQFFPPVVLVVTLPFFFFSFFFFFDVFMVTVLLG